MKGDYERISGRCRIRPDARFAISTIPPVTTAPPNTRTAVRRPQLLVKVPEVGFAGTILVTLHKATSRDPNATL